MKDVFIRAALIASGITGVFYISKWVQELWPLYEAGDPTAQAKVLEDIHGTQAAMKFARKALFKMGYIDHPLIEEETFRREMTTALWYADETWDPEKGATLTSWRCHKLRFMLIDRIRNEFRWTNRTQYQDFDFGNVPDPAQLNASIHLNDALVIIDRKAGELWRVLLGLERVADWSERNGISTRTAYTRIGKLREQVSKALIDAGFSLDQAFSSVAEKGIPIEYKEEEKKS